MATKTYLTAAEGFDIYPNGPISTTDYPWTVSAQASTGTIVANVGAFANAKALAFTGGTTVAASGLQYNYPANLRSGFGTTAATDRGVLGIGFWFNMNQMTAAATHWLMRLGSSTVAGFYNVFGVTAATPSAASMMFLSPSGSPVTYPIATNTYYWVDIRFAIDSETQTWRYEYRVNNETIATGLVPWTELSVPAGNNLNKLYFYVAEQLQWRIDDLVVRSACAADANWEGSRPVALADIAFMNARRIYLADAVSNGSINQWSSSVEGVPNYEAATDLTGTAYVSASDGDQTDLYKFEVPVGTTPADINGLIYRGTDARLGAVNPQIKEPGGVQSNMSPQSFGASRFIGLSESNNGVSWTPASIAAAEFGLKST